MRKEREKENFVCYEIFKILFSCLRKCEYISNPIYKIWFNFFNIKFYQQWGEMEKRDVSSSTPFPYFDS